MRIEDIHDPRLAARLQQKLDRKTKPTGSLGRLEELALQIGIVLGSEAPRFEAAQVLVCAGDHGLAAHGVSAYPSDVTWQMVENFLAGGAAVSVLARQHGLGLTVVDCGVRHEFTERPGLRVCKVGWGTGDSLQGPAMQRLGEGSGAVLAWTLLESACAILRGMASFGSAGVSDRSA